MNPLQITRIRILVVSAFTLILGVHVCSSWLFNLQSLIQFYSQGNFIKFNSGFLFILLALCLYFSLNQIHKLTVFFGLLVFLFAFLTFMQDLLNVDLGIDQLFVKESRQSPYSYVIAGRMAMVSSFCFSLMGLAILLRCSKNSKLTLLSQYLFHGVSLISFVILIGYLFNSSPLYQWSDESAIPPLAAFLFFILSLSYAFLNRRSGIFSVFTGNYLGSVKAKRLLPAMLISLISISYIIHLAYKKEFIALDMALALCIIAFCIVCLALVWFTSNLLNKNDYKRKHTQKIVGVLNKEFETRLFDRTSELQGSFKELQEQKELFFGLFRSGPVAKALANIKTGIMLDCSDAYLNLFGFQREDIVGKTAIESGITADENLREEILGQIKDRGSAIIKDYQLRKKNGELIWVTAYVNIISINNEDHLLSTMLDVTDRKKIEDNYRYILQNASDIIYTTDKYGNFEFINESIQKLTGFAANELIGKHFTYIIHKDFKRDALQFYLEQYKQNKESSYFECKLVNKDFREKWIGQNVKIRTNNQNEYIGFHAVAREITERKNLELDLQIKNERLTEAMQIGKFGYFEQELITNKITRSKELYDIFELDGEAAIIDIDSFNTFIMPEYREAFNKHFEELTVLKKPSNIEFQIKTGKGNLKFVSSSARPILDRNGKVELIRGTTQDITLRKQSEIELIKAKELSEASVKIKDHFLTNMTHEIRTPMNAILGFSGILSESPLNPKQKEWLKTIISSGENLLVILNDLLDFSKIEAGMIQIENIPLALNQQLHNFLTLSELKALEKGLDLSLEIMEPLPDLVYSDPVRLQQIFMNLLSNAIKFTEKGFVRLSTHVMKESENEVLIEFRVMDTGIGISKEQRDHVFERFTQASSDTTRMFGGTGLGLSIVKELCLLLNGTIELLSKPGKGSEFIITLPFTKCTPVQIEDYKKQLLHNGKEDNLQLDSLHILLVEDNRINQQFVIALMEEFGFVTTIANNGKEAIEQLMSQRFDLILMDVQMPLMDGFEATRVIRSELSLQTPIIAVTANAANNEKDKCITSGMNDYIAKPLVPGELYLKIKTLLPGKLIDKQNHARFHHTISKIDETVFDLAAFIEKLNGDKEVFHELITIFLEDTPIDFKKLESAIAEESYLLIEQISHKLYSSFTIMCVTGAAKILKEMEQDAENKMAIADIKEKFISLYAIYDRVKKDLIKLQYY